MYNNIIEINKNEVSSKIIFKDSNFRRKSAGIIILNRNYTPARFPYKINVHVVANIGKKMWFIGHAIMSRGYIWERARIWNSRIGLRQDGAD